MGWIGRAVVLVTSFTIVKAVKVVLLEWILVFAMQIAENQALVVVGSVSFTPVCRPVRRVLSRLA